MSDQITDLMRTGRGLCASFDPAAGPERAAAFKADVERLFTAPSAPVVPLTEFKSGDQIQITIVATVTGVRDDRHWSGLDFAYDSELLDPYEGDIYTGSPAVTVEHLPADPPPAELAYVHITHGPWEASGHQCGDLVVGGCDESVPQRPVTLHTGRGGRELLAELGECPNRCGTAEVDPAVPPPMERKPAPDENAPIELLGFGARVRNLLRRDGIHTVGWLLAHSEMELSCIRNFGPVRLREVRDVLAAHGLELRS